MKKELKRLVLKKDVIVNLTDDKMSRIKGGTNFCGPLFWILQFGDRLEKYSDGPYMPACEGILDDPYGIPEDYYDSQFFVNGGCLLTTVNVYGNYGG